MHIDVNFASTLAVHEEPRDLEEGALLGELFDRVTAVAQDALLTIEERDGAPARARVGVARVEAGRAREVDRTIGDRADGQVRA